MLMLTVHYATPMDIQVEHQQLAFRVIKVNLQLHQITLHKIILKIVNSAILRLLGSK